MRKATYWRLAVLLVLLGGIGVLWHRSETRVDALVLFHHQGMPIILSTYDRSLHVIVSDIPCGDEYAYTVSIESGDDVPFINDEPEGSISFMGFRLESWDVVAIYEPAGRLLLAAVPLWSIAAALVLFAAVREIVMYRRFKRPSKGLCRQCGYNLCATPERCPECGTVVEAPVTFPPGTVPARRVGG